MHVLSALALCVSSVFAVEPLVNLGYARYEGTEAPNGVTSWLGMRFAAPPVGELRFAAPADPEVNTAIQPADQVRNIMSGWGNVG